MKKIENRNVVPIKADMSGAITRREKGEAWGDNLPIIRMGAEVGFADHRGNVYSSIEAMLVATHDGCKCTAVASVEQAINKIAQFLALVAMGAKPSEIASLLFHDEIFMFETFSDTMEGRGLVEHVEGELVEGYYPLGLTDEGEAALRMCLESEMVDLSADIYQQTIPVQLPRDRELVPLITSWQPLSDGVAPMTRLPDTNGSRGRAADMRRIAKSKR